MKFVVESAHWFSPQMLSHTVGQHVQDVAFFSVALANGPPECFVSGGVNRVIFQTDITCAIP